jgi:hypothetical protein
MRSVKWGAVAAAALFVALSASGALAQQSEHKTGGLPTPEAEKQSIPQAPVFRDFLPQAVDLSRYMPAVGDQANQGSCVGWATAYAARAYYAQQIEHRDTSLPENIPSPAWLFDIIHIGDDCDGGAYIPDAMRVLMRGAYSLKDFPYDDTKCPRPVIVQRSKATDFRIDSFEQVWDQQEPDLDKVKGALARGNPVVILASLDKAFWDISPAHPVWQSDRSKKDEGGHAITLVGYDDATQTFKFINQWSTQWGVDGYGRMSYDTFAARVYQGYIMHLPGDPQASLIDADFVADVHTIAAPPVNTPPAVFQPPLNVRPTSANRELEAALPAPDLGQLACGRVDVTTDANGNRVAVGFVGTQAELDKVGEALKGQVDDNQVTLAPWPACEVRLTLAGQLADSDTPQAVIDPVAPKVGDSVQIGVESPGFASYMYALYFSADGTVLSLTQPSSVALKPKAAHTQLKFGDAQPDTVSLEVQQPVGDEMLLVVASEKPLFDSALPDRQTDRAFLSALREATLGGGSGRVTATLLPVTTTE